MFRFSSRLVCTIGRIVESLLGAAFVLLLLALFLGVAFPAGFIVLLEARVLVSLDRFAFLARHRHILVPRLELGPRVATDGLAEQRGLLLVLARGLIAAGAVLKHVLVLL